MEQKTPLGTIPEAKPTSHVLFADNSRQPNYETGSNALALLSSALFADNGRQPNYESQATSHKALTADKLGTREPPYRPKTCSHQVFCLYRYKIHKNTQSPGSSSFSFEKSQNHQL